VAWLAGGVGCATTSKGPSEASTQATQTSPSPPPGAEGWSGRALSLPEGAPIVAVARLDRLFGHARSLRSWLAAEPAMFGDEGEAFVQRFRAFWGAMRSRLGFDLLSDEAPRRFGLDASEPAYLGFYPAAAGGGVEFVETVRSTLRRELDLEDDRDLLTVLRDLQEGSGAMPEGLNATVLEKVRSQRPYTGFRVVLPTSDALLFLNKFSQFARASGYTSMEAPDELLEDDAWKVRAFYDFESDWPGFVLRFNEHRVVVDVLFRAFEAQPRRRSETARLESLRNRFRRLFERFEPGRPDAPALEKTSAIGISIDQRGAARYARLEGYRNVLESLTRSDAGRRDDILVRGLSYATMIARNWRVATDRLTGLSYAFRGPASSRETDERESDRLFELNMTLVGRRPTSPLSIRSTPVGLGIEERGFGASLGLEMLFASQWRDWLEIEDVSEMVDYSKARDFQPIAFTLTLPRNLALLAVNLEDVSEQKLPTPFDTLHEHRDRLRRLELATAGRLGRTERDSSYVALLALEPGTEASRRRRIAEAFPPIVASLFRIQAGDTGETFESIQPTSWQEDELTALSVTDDEDVVPLYYYIHGSEERPFVLLTYGLDREPARREVDDVLKSADQRAVSRAALVRLEPATLVDATTRFESNAYEPLDLGILTQRLGPLVLTVDPEVEDDVQRIRYKFEIRPPPEL
jgi:hypothetical protein